MILKAKLILNKICMSSIVSKGVEKKTYCGQIGKFSFEWGLVAQCHQFTVIVIYSLDRNPRLSFLFVRHNLVLFEVQELQGIDWRSWEEEISRPLAFLTTFSTWGVKLRSSLQQSMMKREGLPEPTMCFYLRRRELQWWWARNFSTVPLHVHFSTDAF